MLDPREDVKVESENFHLLEVITDSDYAGSRDDQKSTSSFQIYNGGNLIESRVRSQRRLRYLLERPNLSQWWQDAQMEC